MNGNIEVVDQTQTSSPSSPTSLADNTQSSANTVGPIMVPTQNIQLYITDLESRGFDINSTYNFKNI